MNLQEKIQLVFPKMDKEERDELMSFYVVGIPVGGQTLGYGMDLYNKFEKFTDDLLKKYGIDENIERSETE